jgi:hypothetical protein
LRPADIACWGESGCGLDMIVSSLFRLLYIPCLRGVMSITGDIN